jgi:hypothetical protein
MHIMGHMSGKALALSGAVGAAAAAIGIYITRRKARRAFSDVLEPLSSEPLPRDGRIDIDDDAAADIIMRAKPALERARAY